MLVVWLKFQSEHKLLPAMTVDGEGQKVRSRLRTSSATYLEYDHDEVVTRIEQRIAAVTMLPRGK